LFAAVPATAAVFSLCCLLAAAWIPLKAELAQWLIERSWRAVLAGGAWTPPWPWADTQAVAELHVPAQRIRLLVLEGQSGRNLAFGPVLASPSGRDIIVSGHRDTHFRFLQRLRIGDRLHWRDDGGERWYEVRQLDVVDSRSTELVIEPGVDRLSLVTCFPFDSAAAGGPLRFVATAYSSEP
jgi:sortase A